MQDAQHALVGTRDETTGDREGQEGTSRATTTLTGNPGLRTAPEKDVRVGLRPRQTVLRVGKADGRRGRCCSVATAEEVRDARGTVTANFAEGDEFTSAKVACNVRMMNEQQRSVLRRSHRELFMDEICQLTTGAAGHVDLAEIGNMGLSEIFFACDVRL